MNKDAKTLILEFNRDPESRKLQAFYRRKAMMEIMGKARDEESHSAFLAWLLDGKDLTASHSDSPLMWLLQILVLREETVKAKIDPIPNAIKAQILSRTLQFKIDKVKTEEIINNAMTHNYFKKNFKFKKGEEKDGQDRLDIYIKCSITEPKKCGGYVSFEVFIENKVLSTEGGAKPEKNQVFVEGISCNKKVKHDELKQTERYYKALSYDNDAKNLQLFVYLTPEGLDFSESKHYFQVSYQDILDYILTPLIQNEDLSERSKFLIQDYIDGLSIPTLDEKERKRMVMAITPIEMKSIKKFKSKNKNLLISCLNALAKKSLKNPLTPDDEILVNFAIENKNLLYAVLTDSTKKTADKGKSTDYLNQLLECEVKKQLYLVYPNPKDKTNFLIYDDSNFGFEFLKSFALHCVKRFRIDNITDLIKRFNHDCWKSNPSQNAFYKAEKPNHFEEIPHFSFTLYAMKSNWSKKYLLNITSKKAWDFYSFEVLG